jgi:hypothetical protein
MQSIKNFAEELIHVIDWVFLRNPFKKLPFQL